jgi:DNA-binding SARP family transcriptional activator
MDATHLLPQTERLLRRIEGLESPLVELWGWPGSGSSAILQALLARPEVVGLAVADLATEEVARAALAAAARARRVVVAGDPGERLADLERLLLPGQQLVFASGSRRPRGTLSLALIPPQELLLTAPEVARLWHLLCGRQPRASAAQALWRAADGWYRPVRLALEASGGLGLETATAEQLLEILPVRLFFRHEVLDALPAPERERLLAAPRERPLQAAGTEATGSDAAGEAPIAAWQVVEELGMWVEGGERDRLPVLLAACLERERRRRRLPAAPPRSAGAAAGGRLSTLETHASEIGQSSRLDGLALQGGEAGTPRESPAAAPPGSTGGIPRRALRESRRPPHVQDGHAALAGGHSSAGVGIPVGSVPAGGGGAEHALVPAGTGRARSAAAAARRPAYQVRLFGGPMVFQLGDGGDREVGWKLRRSFQVLAFLAASPDLQAGREDLEEAVWPADGERTIDRNFHPTLSHLRRALERERRGLAPPPLLFRGGIYRLNPEIDWDIDLQEFQRRLAEGRQLVARGDEGAAADTLQRAWKLYRGPFMQGYYEAWVASRREETQQLYAELLRELGDLSVRLERADDALDAYRAVLLEDPLQERTHLAVMRLYAGDGRRDLVRRQYERLCTLLLDELGVEPLPETVQEYHRLMS